MDGAQTNDVDRQAISDALTRIDPEESLEVLRTIIAIDSVWGNEKPLAAFLAEQFTSWGLSDVQLVDVPAGRPSVAARIRGSGGGKSLIFNGHIDIYELSSDWTIDPWTLRVQDGKAYGAGIADMKGGTAAQIAAIKYLQRAGVRLAGDVIMTGVAAHFEGGVGTRALLEAGVTADAAIVGEPSSMGITVAQRGAVYVNVTTRGKQAHTIAAHEGVNAILHMVRFVEALQTLDIPYRPHPLLGGPPLMNVGTIHGGTKHNQVPDRCTISIDFRILPGQTPEDVVERLRGIADDLHREDPSFAADIEFNPHWLSGPRVPFEADPNWEIVRTVDEAYHLATGKDPRHQGFNAWTDMAVLSAFGVECVNIGPGDPPYNFADEYIFLEQYHNAVRTYVAAAMMFCRER